jgi:hypothetical protein
MPLVDPVTSTVRPFTIISSWEDVFGAEHAIAAGPKPWLDAGSTGPSPSRNFLQPRDG